MAKYLRRSFRRKKEVRFLGQTEIEEGESPPPRYRPDGIDALCKATGFSRKQLQLMYRSFKQECPTGMVNEATFRRIYAQFFPYGDVSQYAHHVFRAFDVRHSGVVNFEELVLGVSSLSRGSVSDKLRWVFTLYDADGDGAISRQELRDVVAAVHRLGAHGMYVSGTGACRNGAEAAEAGPSSASPSSPSPIHQRSQQSIAERHADRIFQKLDLNRDGLVTWDEFLETCLKDETISSTLAVLDVSS